MTTRAGSDELSPGVTVSRCGSCGMETFPERLWCPRCGAREVDDVIAHEGRLAELTTVRRAIGGTFEHPVRIGTVHATGGAILVARIEDEARTGDTVALFTRDGAPVARRSG